MRDHQTSKQFLHTDMDIVSYERNILYWKTNNILSQHTANEKLCLIILIKYAIIYVILDKTRNLENIKRSVDKSTGSGDFFPPEKLSNSCPSTGESTRFARIFSKRAKLLPLKRELNFKKTKKEICYNESIKH